jgi:hypothetical protein
LSRYFSKTLNHQVGTGHGSKILTRFHLCFCGVGGQIQQPIVTSKATVLQVRLAGCQFSELSQDAAYGAAAAAAAAAGFKMSLHWAAVVQ